ncbi:MAG: hypothetical protein DRQ89_13685 [Epsilonproteobacteria bacterium]|nr:MAG: hypothetical protein DRQ89_13685 [Campylobacterota bacterium]
MAVFREITTTEPIDLSDGVGAYRYIVDGAGSLSLRKALTPTAFDGDEDVDWEEIESTSHSGAIEWRLGVRNHFYVTDCSITPTGFGGYETTDWVNIETSKLP